MINTTGTFFNLHTDSANLGSAIPTQNKANFKDFLMDAMNEVNSNQKNADVLAQKVITDPGSVDVHEVTIAMAKANLSLTLAQAVTDRLIKGWSEITTTR